MSKYSIILGNLGNTCDRFLSSGYKQQPSKEELDDIAISEIRELLKEGDAVKSQAWLRNLIFSHSK